MGYSPWGGKKWNMTERLSTAWHNAAAADVDGNINNN